MPTDPRTRRSPTLVVGADPDPVTRALIGLYLEPHGYVVHLAATVAEALADNGADPPGVVVCSERAMEQATPEERQALRDRCAERPVVVLLEPGGTRALSRGWPGVRGALTKPVQADALLSALLGTRPGAGAPGLERVAPNGEDSEDSPLAGFRTLIDEMGMDADMVRDLVVSFLERAPAYLADMTAGVEQGELTGVDRAAHTMKGMCGNLRFGRLVTLSDAVRRAAGDGDTDAIRGGLGELRAELDRVSAAVRAQWVP